MAAGDAGLDGGFTPASEPRSTRGWWWCLKLSDIERLFGESGVARKQQVIASAWSASWHQFVERDRQIPHPFASRVVDRVGNRRRDTDNADLAQAFDPERIDRLIRLVDKDYLDIVHVGVHRHMIFGDVGIHDAAKPVIDQRF